MQYLPEIFLTLLSPSYLILMVFGTAMGIIFGAIPGLNATVGMTLMLPFTYKLVPEMGIAMLMGIYIGGISGGLHRGHPHRYSRHQLLYYHLLRRLSHEPQGANHESAGYRHGGQLYRNIF